MQDNSDGLSPKTSHPFDFSTLPNIHEKLSQKEIEGLNGIFESEEVRVQLENFSRDEKETKKKSLTVRNRNIFLSFFGSIILGTGIHVGYSSISNASGLVGFLAFLTSCGISSFLIYQQHKSESTSKYDLSPLLNGVCKILNKNLQYDEGGKFAFQDLQHLVSCGFLKPFNEILIAEDSIELSGDITSINSYELHTLKEDGKNSSITNQCYLTRVQFTNTRHNIATPIHITKDIFNNQDKIHALLQKKAKNLSSIDRLLILVCGIMIALGAWILGNIFSNGSHTAVYILVVLMIIMFNVKSWDLSIQRSKKRVIVENRDFENTFDVICDDQVLSRTIITPAFMDRLVKFSDRTGIIYEFLFYENALYIKKKVDDGYLDIYTTDTDPRHLLQQFLNFYLELQEILSLVHDLNLMYYSKPSLQVSSPEKRT